MIQKINLYVFIFMLLSILLTVGCSGSRQGFFGGFGGGMDAVVVDEEQTISRYDNGLSGKEHHNTITTSVFPEGNLKIGWGFTEQFLVLSSVQIGKLITSDYGIRIFHRKTTPSLFFDLFGGPFNLVDYGEGRRVSVGVGYEFKRNWTVKGDFSFGTYNITSSTRDEVGWFFADLFGGSAGPYSTSTAKAKVYSLGFKINYIWY